MAEFQNIIGRRSLSDESILGVQLILSAKVSINIPTADYPNYRSDPKQLYQFVLSKVTDNSNTSASNQTSAQFSTSILLALRQYNPTAFASAVVQESEVGSYEVLLIASPSSVAPTNLPSRIPATQSDSFLLKNLLWIIIASSAVIVLVIAIMIWRNRNSRSYKCIQPRAELQFDISVTSLTETCRHQSSPDVEVALPGRTAVL